MKIQEILDKITEFILSFAPDKYKNQFKVVVIAIAAIITIILLGAFGFSMFKQF